MQAVHPTPVSSPPFDFFQNDVPLKFPGIVKSGIFFMRIQRTNGKYLSVFGEYGKFTYACLRYTKSSTNVQKESMRT